MNPQQWLPGSSSHRSSSSGSETMRQSATYPQAQAPSLRHDQTPTIASTDMVGKGCCVGLFVLPCSGYGKRVRYCPRDTRPNRSTPDLSRPCDLDAGFRGGRPRQCLLREHRVWCDSVGVGGGRLERPRPYVRSVVHTTPHHFLLNAQIYYSQPGIRPEVNITTNRVFTPLHTISH